MPQPVLSVPAFPNVPDAPGVPALLRSAAGAQNVLTGAFSGVLDPATGGFTGSIDGLLTLAAGQAAPLLGTLRGVLDESYNLAGVMSGAVGGQVLGALTGVTLTGNALTGSIVSTVTQVTGNLSVLGQDSPTVAAETEPFRWGIFDSAGAPIVTGDTVVAFDVAREFKAATYPIEKGGFQSYNKVETPFDVRLTFTQGGTEADRTAFLASIDAALESLDLYDVATPEKTYTSVNVVHMDMRRTSDKGVTLLMVDVGLLQIRATAQTAFTNTANPAGAATTNTGAVQPQTPPAAVPDPPGAT